MTVEKNAFCIFRVNSTEATTQPTLAGSNQFVVKHAGIWCNAIGHTRTTVGFRLLREQSGEINCHRA